MGLELLWFPGSPPMNHSDYRTLFRFSTLESEDQFLRRSWIEVTGR